jgi:hypothetical protein
VFSQNNNQKIPALEICNWKIIINHRWLCISFNTSTTKISLYNPLFEDPDNVKMDLKKKKSGKTQAKIKQQSSIGIQRMKVLVIQSSESFPNPTFLGTLRSWLHLENPSQKR